jgi:hypothetical protein
LYELVPADQLRLNRERKVPVPVMTRPGVFSAGSPRRADVFSLARSADIEPELLACAKITIDLGRQKFKSCSHLFKRRRDPAKIGIPSQQSKLRRSLAVILGTRVVEGHFQR